MTQPTPSTSTIHPPAGKRWAGQSRQVAVAVAVTAVATWPPVIAGQLILGPSALTMLLFGSLVGFTNTIAGGRQLGAVASLVFILIAPVGLIAGQDALAGTCLIALACLAIGVSAYWKRYAGLHIGLVGLLFMICSPAAMVEAMDGGPKESRYLLAVLVGTAVCAFWPILCTPLLHAVNEIPKEAHFEKPDTVRYVIVTTALVSAATLYALVYARNTHGVWLPLTLLMVLQVAPAATRHRAFQRVWGTIAGAVFAALVATAFHGTWIVVAVGIFVFLGLFATMGRDPYSVFAFFLTATVLLGVSASEPAIEASAQRVVYTVIGSAIGLLTYYLRAGISRRVGSGTIQ